MAYYWWRKTTRKQHTILAILNDRDRPQTGIKSDLKSLSKMASCRGWIKWPKRVVNENEKLADKMGFFWFHNMSSSPSYTYICMGALCGTHRIPFCKKVISALSPSSEARGEHKILLLWPQARDTRVHVHYARLCVYTRGQREHFMGPAAQPRREEKEDYKYHHILGVCSWDELSLNMAVQR